MRNRKYRIQAIRNHFLMSVMVLLVFTASVAACDNSSWRVKYEAWRESMRKYADSVRSARDHDTTRYYAKVDTCLTCPEGWHGPYDTEHALTGELYGDCYRHNKRGWTEDKYPDTTYDTTWLPRVQVWLTDDEHKKLMRILNDAND